MTHDRALGFPLPEKADRGTGNQLSTLEVQALVEWAERNGLDALRGHVCIMYGVPYPTVDGLMYHARRQDPEMRCVLRYWGPALKEEHGFAREDYVTEAVIFNGRGEQIANRLGVVRAEELTEMSTKDPQKHRYPVVARKPQEMAENRALWDALSDAYPLGIERRKEAGE